MRFVLAFPLIILIDIPRKTCLNLSVFFMAEQLVDYALDRFQRVRIMAKHSPHLSERQRCSMQFYKVRL